jgi:hypothetical protein
MSAHSATLLALLAQEALNSVAHHVALLISEHSMSIYQPVYAMQGIMILELLNARPVLLLASPARPMLLTALHVPTLLLDIYPTAPVYAQSAILIYTSMELVLPVTILVLIAQLFHQLVA